MSNTRNHIAVGFTNEHNASVEIKIVNLAGSVIIQLATATTAAGLTLTRFEYEELKRLIVAFEP